VSVRALRVPRTVTQTAPLRFSFPSAEHSDRSPPLVPSPAADAGCMTENLHEGRTSPGSVPGCARRIFVALAAGGMAASSVPVDRVSGADGGRLVGHLITVRYRRAVDLYARIWEGQPLGDDEYVLCADEKTQLQALRRCHPAAGGAGPDPPVRVRVLPRRHAGLSGRLRSARRPGTRPHRLNHRHHSFGQLVEQVMSAEPYASAARVSGSSTTVPSIKGRTRSSGCAPPGRPPSWCTYRSTPTG
jgi:hypothetical protein